MGVFHLYRTPLTAGEGRYNILNLFNGLDDKDQPKPRVIAHCEVLEDGRLRWEIPDYPQNRAVVKLSYNGRGPANSTYSAEFPEECAQTPPEAPKARTQREAAKEMAAAVGAQDAPAAGHEAHAKGKAKKPRFHGG